MLLKLTRQRREHGFIAANPRSKYGMNFRPYVKCRIYQDGDSFSPGLKIRMI